MKKIIKYAIARGWDSGIYNLDKFVFTVDYLIERYQPESLIYYRTIYLSHSFAKAFFGRDDGLVNMRAARLEGDGTIVTGTSALKRSVYVDEFKIHLMRLVLMEDSEAIEYLEKYMK